MSIDVAALRNEVKANQLQLQQQYEQTGDARGLLRNAVPSGRCVLKKLWDLLDFPASLALAAVGGYGRGELYPASDIDLLILLPQEASTPLQEKLATLVGYFWDIGLEIGHSVRTMQECLDEAHQRHHRPDRPARSPPADRHQKLFSTFVKRCAAISTRWFSSKQATGTTGAAPSLQRNAVQPRTQLQGVAGRPARSAGYFLDIESGRLRLNLGGP
jgi:[protein-PII] uridylyltransferase